MNVIRQLYECRNNQQVMGNEDARKALSYLDNRNHDGLMELFNQTCRKKNVNADALLNKLKMMK